MYRIIMYKKNNSDQPVYNYLKSYTIRSDKTSRINAGKINDYIELLAQNGLNLGKPFIKYLGNKIWELRPLKNRILFSTYEGGFVLLHAFYKTTQKIPRAEIIAAEKVLNDFLSRCREG